MSTECTSSICMTRPKSFSDRIYSITGLFKKRPSETAYPKRSLYLSEFGRITWNLFHRICAYYPKNPTLQEKELAKKMFEGFTEFFPCKTCKKDLVQDVRNIPINPTSRETLSEWFVKIHNATNIKMKKEPVSYNNIEEIIIIFII